MILDLIELRVLNDTGSKLNNPLINSFKGSSHLLIAGSTWPADEDKLIKWINQSLPYNWKIIIAPHQIEEILLLNLERTLNQSFVRYSQLTEKNTIKAKVLIIDNIGMLTEFYRLGTLAYVGGGFGRGVHNILEPAACGLPIVFGPNYKKFNEAVELIERGGAHTVHSFNQLKMNLDQLIFTKGAIEKKSLICSNYIMKNVGGTEKILDHLKPQLNQL